jgi:hypothetical protein
MLVSSAVLISRNNSIMRLISFAKNGSNQRSIVSVYGPSVVTGLFFAQGIDVTFK